PPRGCPPRARGRGRSAPPRPLRAPAAYGGDAPADEARMGRGSGAETPAPRPRRDYTRGPDHTRGPDYTRDAGRTRPAWYARSHATVAASPSATRRSISRVSGAWWRRARTAVNVRGALV